MSKRQQGWPAAGSGGPPLPILIRHGWNLQLLSDGGYLPSSLFVQEHLARVLATYCGTEDISVSGEPNWSATYSKRGGVRRCSAQSPALQDQCLESCDFAYIPSHFPSSFTPSKPHPPPLSHPHQTWSIRPTPLLSSKPNGGETEVHAVR